MRRNFLRDVKAGFVAFDERLDAWAEPHWPLLIRLGTAMCFALLFAGVTLHVYENGLAQAVVARCGSTCAMPGSSYVASTLCGLAAILLVKIYASITETAKFVFIDSWKHVRPGPPSRDLPRWVIMVHVFIGFVVFFAIAAFASIPHAQELSEHTYITAESPADSGRTQVTLGGRGMLALIFGWWIGGRGVLGFFWTQRRMAR